MKLRNGGANSWKIPRERNRNGLITQFRAALSWLEVSDSEHREQEDELDRQYSLHHAYSCDWIQKNPKARSWMRLGKDELVLWLNGKPGAGNAHSDHVQLLY